MTDTHTHTYMHLYHSVQLSCLSQSLPKQLLQCTLQYNKIILFINFNSLNSSLAKQVVKWLHKPLKLEHAMPTTPHANGEPLLKRSSFLSQFATILLVVWSANGDYCSYYFQFTKGRYLPMRCAGNCVIHPAK